MNYDLSDLLQQKLDLFRSLLSATVSLRDLVEAECDRGTFESLMAAREGFIASIDDIDCRIDEIRREQPSLLSTMTAGTREAARQFAGEIADMAVQTAARTRELERTLTLRRDAMTAEMTHLRHTRNYIHRGDEKPGPRFLNVRL